MTNTNYDFDDFYKEAEGLVLDGFRPLRVDSPKNICSLAHKLYCCSDCEIVITQGPYTLPNTSCLFVRRAQQ